MEMTDQVQAIYPRILTEQKPVWPEGKGSSSPPSQPLYNNAEGTFYESNLTLTLATRIRTNPTPRPIGKSSTVWSRAERLAKLYTAGFQGHGVFLFPCNAKT
jgi:hypothetical protein